jgi:hypothetical protein
MELAGDLVDVAHLVAVAVGHTAVERDWQGQLAAVDDAVVDALAHEYCHCAPYQTLMLCQAGPYKGMLMK